MKTCKICGTDELHTPFADNHLRCKRCYREVRNKDRRVRLNAGLCECGALPEANKKMCAKCLDSRKCAYRKNKTQIKESSAKRYAKNREGIRKQQQLKHQDRRNQIFDHYGRVCACCGEKEFNFLTLDHVDGGGTKHRNEVGDFYRWVVARGFPKGLQPLCFNCNWGRFKNGGICPHQSARLNKDAAIGDAVTDLSIVPPDEADNTLQAVVGPELAV